MSVFEKLGAVAGVLAVLLSPALASAAEVILPDGNTYDVRASGVYEDDAANPFVGMSIFWDMDLRDEASLVYASDHIFEIALMDAANDANVEYAVVQLFDRLPADSPERLIEVRYAKTAFNQWTRVNHRDFPIAPSEVFPYEPVQGVELPSGARVALEPVATIYRGTARERAVIHMFSADIPEDFSNAGVIMAEMWDTALRTNPYFDDLTDVTLVIYRNPRRNRFHTRVGFSVSLNRHPLYDWQTFAIQAAQTQAMRGVTPEQE